MGEDEGGGEGLAAEWHSVVGQHTSHLLGHINRPGMTACTLGPSMSCWGGSDCALCSARVPAHASTLQDKFNLPAGQQEGIIRELVRPRLPWAGFTCLLSCPA